MSEPTTAAPKQYRVHRFEAENFKRIRAVSITPEGQLVELTGKNRQGKTSILDALWGTLEGKDAIQRSPIREGADKARTMLDLGDLIVTRTFNRQEGNAFTTALTVKSREGAVFPKAQTMLDALVSDITFDPLLFARAKDVDKLETLKRLDPGLDFAALELANKTDYDKRRDVNREAERLRALADAIVLPEDGDFDEVDEAALVEQLTTAADHNANIETRKAARERARLQISGNREDAESARARAVEYRRLADEQDEAATNFDAAADKLQIQLDEAPALPDPLVTSELQEKINAARTTNALAKRAAEKFELAAQADAQEAASEALTKAIDGRKAEKAERIAKSKLPVPGLSVEGTMVTLAGQPFDQASDAEQLEASLAIAAALNPRLRLARVRDGSLLDNDAWVRLGQLAEKFDLQIWIETVDKDRPGALVIEDGAVVGSDYEGTLQPKPEGEAEADAKPAARRRTAGAAPALSEEQRRDHEEAMGAHLLDPEMEAKG